MNTCRKCTSTDIYTRYYQRGARFECGRSGDCTEYVERKPYVADVQKECLVHHCRCCGYGWDGPTADAPAPPSAVK